MYFGSPVLLHAHVSTTFGVSSNPVFHRALVGNAFGSMTDVVRGTSGFNQFQLVAGLGYGPDSGLVTGTHD